MSPLKRPRKRQRAQSTPQPSRRSTQIPPAVPTSAPNAGSSIPTSCSSSNPLPNSSPSLDLPANDDVVYNKAVLALLRRLEAIRSDVLSLRDQHLRAAAEIQEKLSTKTIASSAASRVKPVRPSDPSLDFAAAENATIPPTFDPHVRPPSAPAPPTLPTMALVTEPLPSEKLIHEQSIIIRAQAITRKNAELARERLPKQPEAQRNKTWRDYFLDEVVWMATDFREERKWKLQIARKLAKSVAVHHQQKANRLARARLDQHHRTVRLANAVARDVRKFWSQIREIADFRLSRAERVRRLQQSRNDLNKFLERTERISKELAMGLQHPNLNTTDHLQSQSKEHSSLQSRSQSPTCHENTNGDVQVKQVRFADPPFSDPSSSEPYLSRKDNNESHTLSSSQPEPFSRALDRGDGNGAVLNKSEPKFSSLISGNLGNSNHSTHISRSDSQTLNGTASSPPLFTSSIKSNGVKELVDLSSRVNVSNQIIQDEAGNSRVAVVHPPSASEKNAIIANDLSSSQIPSDKIPKSRSQDTDSRERDQPVENGLSGFDAQIDVTARPINAPVELLRGTLRDYQYSGMQWLVNLYRNGSNGILADEMGLGKTIQTISLLAWLAVEQRQWGPHLIIVPTSVMVNWEVEFKRWLPGFKILTYFGSSKERRLKRRGWTDPELFHVCITSYTLAVQDIHILRRRKWFYLILDEAHNIKNFRSQRWQTLLTLSSQQRLLLTGTPLQNSVMELWSLMHFLMPNLFESQSEFKDWFSNPIQSSSDLFDDQSRVVSQLHTVLRPFVLRRLKVDVEKSLPPKYEHVLKCHLSKRQRELYEDFLSRTDVKENLNSGDMFKVMNVLMQLRKVCNHPDLFEGRPILSPFAMNAIFYAVPSCAVGLCYGSVRDRVNLGLMNVDMCSRELSWPGRWHSIEEESVSIEHVVQSVMRERIRADGEILRAEKERAGTAGLRRKERALAFRRSTFLHAAVVSAHRVRERGLLGEDLRSVCSMTPTSLMESIRLKSFSHSQFLPDAASELVSSLELVAVRSSCLLERFVCCITKASAPSVEIRYQGDDREYCRWRDDYFFLNAFSSPYRSLFRAFEVRSQVTIPEKRLVQWDCGKLQLLDSLLRDLQHRGSRVLLFTQMTKMLDILESFLNLHTFRYLRLDGATKTDDRQKIVHRFNTDMKIFCMILTTRAGGVGLNLIGADSVIFYDTDYNPAIDNQAQDRAHRIGQTKPVHVYRLICEQTVEEGILSRARLKQRLETKIISEAGFTTDAIVGRELDSSAKSRSKIMISSEGIPADLNSSRDVRTSTHSQLETIEAGVDSSQGRFHGFGPASFDLSFSNGGNDPLTDSYAPSGTEEFQKFSDKVLSDDEREKFVLDAAEEEKRLLEAEFEDTDESGSAIRTASRQCDPVADNALTVESVLSPVQIFALQFLEWIEKGNVEADGDVHYNEDNLDESLRNLVGVESFEPSGTAMICAKDDGQSTVLSSASVPDGSKGGNVDNEGVLQTPDPNEDAIAGDDLFYELDITEEGRVNYLKALTDADVNIKLYLPLRDGGPEELKVSSVVCGTAAAGLECAEDAAFFPHAYNRMSRTQFATRKQKEKSLSMIRKRMAEKEVRKYNSDTSLPNGGNVRNRDKAVTRPMQDSKKKDSSLVGISTTARKADRNPSGEVSNEIDRTLEDTNALPVAVCSNSHHIGGVTVREHQELSKSGQSDFVVKSLTSNERAKFQKQRTESVRGNGTVPTKKVRSNIDAGVQSGLFKKSSKKLSRKSTINNIKGATTAALSGASGISGKNDGWTKEEDEKLICFSEQFGNNMLLVSDALALDKKVAVGMRQRRSRAHCTQRLCKLVGKDKTSQLVSPIAETKDLDMEKKHEVGLLGTFPHQLYVYTTGQVPENSSGDVHVTQKRVIADARVKSANGLSTEGLLSQLEGILQETKKRQSHRPGLKPREATPSALSRRKRPFMQPIKEDLSLTKSVFTLNQYGSGMQVNGSGSGVVGVETAEAATNRLSSSSLQKSVTGGAGLPGSRGERAAFKIGSTNVGALGGGYAQSGIGLIGRGRGTPGSSNRNASAVKLATSKVGVPVSVVNAGRTNVSSKKTLLTSGVAPTSLQTGTAGKNRTGAELNMKGSLSGNFKKDVRKAMPAVKSTTVSGVASSTSNAIGRAGGVADGTNIAMRSASVKGSGGRGVPLSKMKSTMNRTIPGKQKTVTTLTSDMRERGTHATLGSNMSKANNGDNCGIGPKVSTIAMKAANGVNKLSGGSKAAHGARQGVNSASNVPNKTDFAGTAKAPSESTFQETKVALAPGNVIAPSSVSAGVPTVVASARAGKGTVVPSSALLAPPSPTGMVASSSAGIPSGASTSMVPIGLVNVGSGELKHESKGISRNSDMTFVATAAPKEKLNRLSIDGHSGGVRDAAGSVRTHEENGNGEVRFSDTLNVAEAEPSSKEKSEIEVKKIRADADRGNGVDVAKASKKDVGQFVKEIVGGGRTTKAKVVEERNEGETGG